LILVLNADTRLTAIFHINLGLLTVVLLIFFFDFDVVECVFGDIPKTLLDAILLRLFLDCNFCYIVV